MFAGARVSVKVVCTISCWHKALVACRLLYFVQKRNGLPLFISCQGALCVAVVSATCNLVPVLNGEVVYNSSALSWEKHKHFEEYSV